MTASASRTADAAAEWTALAAELDRWAEAGRAARFWWRDDDLERPGPKLDRLLALHPDAPKSLAVIPATADPALASRLAPLKNITVLQHGWRHANHAPGDAKKSEFGDHRPMAEMLADLRRGRGRLAGMFGPQFRAVLAPPWNRIAPGLVDRLTGRVADPLPDVGIRAISGYGDGGGRGNVAVNTHIDPIAWRGGRGFLGDGAALGMAIDALARRRNAGEHEVAIGLLTHHRVMDNGVWSFVDQFVTVLQNHTGARLAGIDDVMIEAVTSAKAADGAA